MFNFLVEYNLLPLERRYVNTLSEHPQERLTAALQHARGMPADRGAGGFQTLHVV